MNRWLIIVGMMAVIQTLMMAECSIESQKEAKQIYEKALNTDSNSEQLSFLQKSLDSCYSPEIDIQIALLKGDIAYDNKKYKTAKNYYNKMLTLIDKIKDTESKKELHLLSYVCLRDTYKAMGENELASIMQEKYDMRKRQKDNSHITNLVSSGDIVKELQLSNAEGTFRGVGVTQAVSLHVNYKYDSVSFSDDGKMQARELAIALKELQIDYPGTKVEIVGYTDTKGDAKYNLNLSNRRANSLKKYLVSNFTFNKISFSYTGKGESEPICSEGYVVKNNNEYRCSGNEDTDGSRRVEIIFGY